MFEYLFYSSPFSFKFPFTGRWAPWSRTRRSKGREGGMGGKEREEREKQDYDKEKGGMVVCVGKGRKRRERLKWRQERSP